jgi:hypothetical protein
VKDFGFLRGFLKIIFLHGEIFEKKFNKMKTENFMENLWQGFS